MNRFSPTDLPRIDFRSIAVPGTSGSRQRQPPGAQQSHSSPGDIASSPQGLDNPALLRDMLLANPHELSLLKERNPPLADALLSGDLGKLINTEDCQADLRGSSSVAACVEKLEQLVCSTHRVKWFLAPTCCSLGKLVLVSEAELTGSSERVLQLHRVLKSSLTSPFH